MRQMYVNEQPKLKNSYNSPKHDAARSARMVRRAKRSSCGGFPAEINGPLASQTYRTPVARDLRICLGWLFLQTGWGKVHNLEKVFLP